jgi:branched-chain amino acid transport system substrate-binding protein
LPIQELKESGADVFLNLIWRSGGASSAALKAHDIGWRPLQLVPSGAMVGRFFRNQDEFKEASGLVVTVWMPFWNPRWTSGIYGDKRTMTFERSPVPTYLQWMTKYNPDADPNDGFYVTGANMSQALVRVLRNCGDELTRANVLKQASHIDEQLSMMLQYTPITTSPNDYQPVKQFFLGKTNEHGWYRVKTVNTK